MTVCPIRIWSLNHSEQRPRASRLGSLEKDKIQRVSAFDGVTRILGEPQLPLNDRFDGFFVDYNLSPLMMHENYIKSYSAFNQRPAADGVNPAAGLADAALAVSDLDLVDAKVSADHPRRTAGRERGRGRRT